MGHHKSGQGVPKARVSRGVWGHAPPKQAIKQHVQHSQAEICSKMALKIAVLLHVPFIIYPKITLNIPFKLFFWSMTSLQLRCFSKSGFGILSQNRDCPA